MPTILLFTLGSKQTAFDVESSAIEAAVDWHRHGTPQHMVVHSDSTSAIA